jgi:hypothetical protein
MAECKTHKVCNACKELDGNERLGEDGTERQQIRYK